MLTEKEKQVLFKKAQAQGIDLDEFEMVLDARLVELEKAEKAKAAAAAPKSNKLGDVKKCPNCGAENAQGVKFCNNCGAPMTAPAPAPTGICPGCGKQNEPGTKFCSECGTKL